ncbi:MAG: hypothetical protein K8T90_03700 [Planctomycetes bacterium]|nr:hypothetical protein [Planctomycetota bacterium]
MKKLVPFALLGLAFCVVSCKKEPTPGEQLDKGLNAAKEKAAEGTEKINEALKGK